MKNLDLSELPPNLRAKVLPFRRELIAEREEQEKKLREALDHFKREVEIETAVRRRLAENFSRMHGSLTVWLRTPRHDRRMGAG